MHPRIIAVTQYLLIGSACDSGSKITVATGEVAPLHLIKDAGEIPALLLGLLQVRSAASINFILSGLPKFGESGKIKMVSKRWQAVLGVS